MISSRPRTTSGSSSPGWATPRATYERISTFSWLIFISSSVAASGPLASKISHTFWIATRLRCGDACRLGASSSWEFVTRRVSQDLAALPHPQSHR